MKESIERWRVTATGVSGAPYVYEVSAPAGTSETAVQGEAYAIHGRRYRDGEVPEYLGPCSTAERIA